MSGSLEKFRPPHGDPPEGFHYEAVEEGDRWVTPAVGAGRCRFGAGGGHRACGKPAVASVMRSKYGRNGFTKNPWDYCAEHLYEHWIEDGKVMGWRLVRHDDGDTGRDLAERFGV